MQPFSTKGGIGPRFAAELVERMAVATLFLNRLEEPAQEPRASRTPSADARIREVCAEMLGEDAVTAGESVSATHEPVCNVTGLIVQLSCHLKFMPDYLH